MSAQWQIFKSDGSVIGPLAPIEVRDALREGGVDPFDLVCRIGSKLKQPLVEVDEIFVLADEAEKGKVDSVYDQAGDFSSRLEETVAVDLKKVVGIETVEKESPLSKVKQLPASPAAVKPNNKRHAKKYFLVDAKKRFHGPLSAPDIQSLFYRGLIQSDTYVTKSKSGPKVAIQQFVVAYMGGKAKKYNSEQTRFNFNAIVEKKGLPSSKVMDQWARTVAHHASIKPNKAHIRYSVIAVALMVLVGFVWKYLPEIEDIIQRNVEEIMPKAELLGPVVTPQPPAAAAEVVAEEPVVVEPVPEVVKPKASEAPKKVRAAKPPKKAAPIKAVPRQRDFAPKALVRVQPKREPAPNYAQFSGQIVTIANGSYSLSGLSRCGLKCTLRVVDGRGVAVDVIFFKGQYEAELKQKSGRASFMGRLDVKGSRNILYLQSLP